MKKIVTLACLFTLLFFVSEAQVGVNILIPDSSAALQVESTTKGLGLPRLTSIQRDSINNPLKGLTIFNTVDSLIEYWNGECWLKAYEKNCNECAFTLALDHYTDTLDRLNGDSVSAILTLNHTHGLQQISIISLSSLPQGAYIYFNGPTTINTNGTVQIVVKADLCAAVGGHFPVIIQAFCGDQIHFLSYNVYIRPPVPVTVAVDQLDYNLQALTGLPSSPAQFVLLNVNSSVELKASASTIPAFTTGNLDPNSLVCIVNNGDILGRGGDGGAFAFNGSLLIAGGNAGLQGGDAMHLTTRTILQNYGAIYGGGSGGGSVGLAIGTPNIPIIGPIVFGVGYCGGGGSESGLGGVVNPTGNITLGLFQNGGNATCCIGSIPGAGPTANYPINIPISVATITVTPTIHGGDGGGFAQTGLPGYLDIALKVCVQIPIIGNICINIPIPGNIVPFYGPTSAAPGWAVFHSTGLTGLANGTYFSAQVKGKVGP